GVDYLNSVWGSGAADIYTAGEPTRSGKALLCHSTNGTAWNADSVAVVGAGDGDVNAVWGASNTSVYAVGSGGVILHGSAGSWTQVTDTGTTDLLGVWGTSDNDVWAVGVGGKVLHNTGGATWD